MSVRHPGRLLVIESTYACNLRCPHCFTHSATHTQREDELTTDEICRLVLDEAGEIGTYNVVWSGGEFLMRPDHLQLVRESSARGFLNVVLTNTCLLDDARLGQLKAAADGCLILGIGLDSTDEAVNLATRNQRPSQILDVLRRCDQLGIGYWINVTLSRETLPTFEPTIDELAARGVYFNRVPYAGRGFGAREFETLAFTREDMRDRIHPLLRKHFLGYASFTPFFASPSLVARNTLRENPAGNFLSFGCYVGAATIVSPTGGVGFCGLTMEHVEAGNVRQARLRDILRGEAYQRNTDRSNLKGRCGRCRYRETCGGCRAMAYWRTGDFLAEDPTCFFEPEDESTMCELEHEMNQQLLRHMTHSAQNTDIVAYHQLKQRFPHWAARQILRVVGSGPLMRLKALSGVSLMRDRPPRPEGASRGVRSEGGPTSPLPRRSDK